MLSFFWEFKIVDDVELQSFQIPLLFSCYVLDLFLILCFQYYRLYKKLVFINIWFWNSPLPFYNRAVFLFDWSSFLFNLTIFLRFYLLITKLQYWICNFVQMNSWFAIFKLFTMEENHDPTENLFPWSWNFAGVSSSSRD